MRTLLTHLGDKLHTSFWFVPGLIVVTSGLLADAALRLDAAGGESIVEALPWLHEVSAEGTRSLLSTAATAVLGLAGVTFSATLVALTLASSQFGPRLLRNFIAAKSNQVSLGILLGNFVICLVILRSVRGTDENLFVPHVSTLVAFIATLGSLGTFIFFIHSLATSLQADHVVAGVHAELRSALNRYFPDDQPDEKDEEEAETERANWDSFTGEHYIGATTEGYVLAIDVPTLVELATARDLSCRVIPRPGHFVRKGTALIAFSGEKTLDDEGASAFRKCLLMGSKRTPEQDFEFALRQLVEIGLRALSPGINDPFTAINCIDFLGAALHEVADRRLPARVYHDAEKTPRVRVRPTSFDGLVGAAFNQLRQASVTKPDVSIRILEALTGVAEGCGTPTRREAVCRHAETVAEAALSRVDSPTDRESIEQALAGIRKMA